MGVIVGFVVGYVMGTRAGEAGYEELKATMKSITSSGEVKDLIGGIVSVLGDLISSGKEALAERSAAEGPSVRRVA